MTDSNFLPLTGNEAIWVVPRLANGSLAGYQWITTTQAIASLASGSPGNATHVIASTYNVTTSDRLILADCVGAGNTNISITLLGVASAVRPVKIKKIDNNPLYTVYVYTADNSQIEFNSAGVPFQIVVPGQCVTFDPSIPISTQYWIAD